MTVKRRISKIAWICTLTVVTFAAFAEDKAPEGPILFTNVDVFDGVNEKLKKDVNVVVTGNTITQISSEDIAVAGGQVIDGTGHTLMPGLIDSHTHLMFSGITFPEVLFQRSGYQAIQGVVIAEQTLMNGVTTVRDMAGDVFDLKRAIDEGTVLGPRVYPSGAMISQTSGHADFRLPVEPNPTITGTMTVPGQKGAGLVVDGVPIMLAATREQLRLGASQVKLAISGSVSGINDPLDTTQFTLEEIEAAVEVAQNWGTYVTVHSYSAKAIQNAIRGGVRNVEHGQMIDEETAKLMKQTNTSICLQPFYDDEDAVPFPPGSFQEGKYHDLISGTDPAFRLAQKYDLLVGFGTDTQGMPALTERQGAQLAKLVRYFKPWEVLKIATSQNYEIFKRSGPRDPYPGENGVVREGAYADLLLVDGNPLEDIALIADPHKNFVVIMKDGKIYKNTLN